MKCGIAVFAIASFVWFWQNTQAGAVLGLLFMILTMLAIERSIHSVYTFTDDGFLVFEYGKLSKKKAIMISDIVKVRKIKTVFGLSHYLLITYGAGRMISAQPQKEDAFVEEIKKRQNEMV